MLAIVRGESKNVATRSLRTIELDILKGRAGQVISLWGAASGYRRGGAKIEVRVNAP